MERIYILAFVFCIFCIPGANGATCPCGTYATQTVYSNCSGCPSECPARELDYTSSLNNQALCTGSYYYSSSCTWDGTTCKCRICTRDCNYWNNATDCDQTPGCHWSSNQCNDCPRGYYCNGSQAPQQCPEPFVDATGITALHECRAIVTCGSEEVEIYCYAFDANGNCELDTQNSGYAVQGNFDPNTYYSNLPAPKVSYQSYTQLWYTFNNFNETSDGYHIELKPHYDAPRREQVPDDSWKPVSYTLQCISNTMPCSTFVNDPDDYNPENGNQYDSISSTLTATNCTTHQLIGDNATWDSENSVWNVSGCKCDLGQDQWIEDNDHKCMKKGHKVRDALGQNTTTPINTVHSIYENVIFDTIDKPENTSAVCRRCLPDNPGQNKYYYVQGLVDGHVKQCTLANVFMGYYRPRDCSGNNVDWGENTLTENPCPRKECPAGKTTSEPMPIGSNNCHYSSQTKFCDANGCFHITDAPDWSWGL